MAFKHKKTATYDFICSECRKIYSFKLRFSDKAIKSIEGIDDSILKQLQRKKWQADNPFRLVCVDCQNKSHQD